MMGKNAEEELAKLHEKQCHRNEDRKGAKVWTQQGIGAEAIPIETRDDVLLFGFTARNSIFRSKKLTILLLFVAQLAKVHARVLVTGQ